MRRFIASAVLVLAAVNAAAEEAVLSKRCPKLVPSNQPVPRVVSHSTCTNGDFEAGLDGNEWSGRHGVMIWNGDPEFLAAGIASDPDVFSCAGHQTPVAAGVDPLTAIRTVAHAGSTGSLRLGNAAADARTEMIEKTFVVERTERVIHFSYAVVMQVPHHRSYQNPSFEVRVVDAKGNLVPGTVIDLGAGASKLIAGEAALAEVPETLIRYRDWSCGRIEIPASHIGQTVTVQFITEDCVLGGHFSYAYIDNFCGGGNCGPVFELAERSVCGSGSICFRATPDPFIELRILQTGEVLTNPLKNGDRFCFAIDPAADFDYVATAVFPDGSVRTVGAALPVDLITNGNFELGDRDFTSELSPTASVRPGEYAVLDAIEASVIADTWIAQSALSCTNGSKFLVANGTTSGSGARTVWSQRVTVRPNSTYRFAVHARNLPQCAFDVVPRIELRFSAPLESSLHTVITAAAASAWMTIERELRIPPDMTSLTIELRLLDDTAGDGNDLALDVISLCRISG